MPYWNEEKDMKETTDYIDFFKEAYERDTGKTASKNPRIICPDCQDPETHPQDDADFTFDCKNLYKVIPKKQTINGRTYIGSDHHQCLCYSRAHGIRTSKIRSELAFGEAKRNPKLKLYLYELLHHQVHQLHQANFVQQKIVNILKEQFNENIKLCHRCLGSFHKDHDIFTTGLNRIKSGEVHKCPCGQTRCI